MKLRIIEFFSSPIFEVKPGDVADFDDERAALLLEGGFAVAEKEVEKTVKPSGEKATRPRKRKED
jgi:hypothetical protein